MKKLFTLLVVMALTIPLVVFAKNGNSKKIKATKQEVEKVLVGQEKDNIVVNYDFIKMIKVLFLGFLLM